MSDAAVQGRVVEARDLVREYAPGRGVCGVSLALERGECLAVLGRNGCGKSTLVRLLLGLERPQRGALTVLGTRPGSRAQRRLTGVLPEASVHWDALTGRQNAWFAARSHGLEEAEIRRRSAELFRLADLEDRADDPVGEWSYGMRRKLGLVQALCHRPPLLVMDEPTAGVDAHFLPKLAELVRGRSLEGRSTWIAGNDPDWVGGVADRVVFMDGGRIAAAGRVEDLLAEVSTAQELRMELAGPVVVDRPRLAGLRSFEQEGRGIVALLDRDPRLVVRLLEWVVSRRAEVRSLQVRIPTLRDAFLLKTGRTIEA